jgi:hypothetical protein
MTDETKDLQRALEAEKHALANNLTELADRARDLTDWRTQVRARPLPAIGLGLGAGFLLAVLMDRRPARVRSRAATAGVGPGAGRFADGDLVPAPAHPTVDRIVNALVGVAMTKALEVIAEVVPSFTEHLEDEEPGAFHLDDAPRQNGAGR